VAGLDGRLTAVSTEDGRVRWRVETGGPIYSSPALGEERVFVGSQDGHLYAFDRSTGDLAWKVSGGGGEVNGSPAYHEGRVVIGTDAGVVLCVKAETGETLWKVTTGGQIKSRPSFRGPLAWITGYDGYLHGIDWSTGSEMARIRTDSSAFSSPAIHEDTAYFGALDGRFFAIRLEAVSS
jgi:outer membrane protein assembly factor BamB